MSDSSLGNRMRTHGHKCHRKASPTYTAWQSMLTRCINPKSKTWRYYGGRGIKVCSTWAASFESFLADMGERPPSTTLDRKDNSKHYSPDNCRWATRKEQMRNTRDNHMLTHNGKTQCMTSWAEGSRYDYWDAETKNLSWLEYRARLNNSKEII